MISCLMVLMAWVLIMVITVGHRAVNFGEAIPRIYPTKTVLYVCVWAVRKVDDDGDGYTRRGSFESF